jgi:hypothetical protein
MTSRDGNEGDPFTTISMPLEVLTILRRRLTAIECSVDTLSVHLASERAQGVIEAVEVLKVLKPVDIETLYLAVEDAVQVRIKTLML